MKLGKYRTNHCRSSSIITFHEIIALVLLPFYSLCYVDGKLFPNSFALYVSVRSNPNTSTTSHSSSLKASSILTTFPSLTDERSKITELQETSSSQLNHDIVHLNEDEIKRSVGAAFYNRLVELREYKSLHNDTLVPKRYPKNPKLGNWVNKQRQEYRLYQQGKKSSMNPIRLQLLEKNDFQWQLPTNNDTDNSQIEGYIKDEDFLFKDNDKVHTSNQWDDHYEELKRFHKIYGHCRVPIKYKSTNLGSWTVLQRQQYRLYQSQKQLDRKKKGSNTPVNLLSSYLPSTITEEQIELLDSLKFDWNWTEPKRVSKYEIIWEQRYQELIDYKQEHGDCKVPINYSSNPKLAHWVSNQRKHYNLLQKGKKSFLSQKRLELLNKIDFVWKVWDF